MYLLKICRNYRLNKLTYDNYMEFECPVYVTKFF